MLVLLFSPSGLGGFRVHVDASQGNAAFPTSLSWLFRPFFHFRVCDEDMPLENAKIGGRYHA